MTKAGIKTTEFWVHNVLQLASVLSVGCGQIDARLGAMISAALGVAYIAARAVVKYGVAAAAADASQPAPPPAGPAPEQPVEAAPAAKKPRGTAATGAAVRQAALLLCVAVGGLALAGCARNLVARWAQANASYDAALASLHQLRASGAMSRRQEAQVAAYMPAAEAALHKALADARANRAGAQRQDLVAFRAALLHLRQPQQ